MLKKVYNDFCELKKKEYDEQKHSNEIEVGEFLKYVYSLETSVHDTPSEYNQIMDTFRARVTGLMTAGQLSQNELAGLVACSSANLSKLLGTTRNKSKSIPPERLRDFANALKVTEWYLIGLVDGIRNSPPTNLCMYEPAGTADSVDLAELNKPAFIETEEIQQFKTAVIEDAVHDRELFKLFRRVQKLSQSQRNIIKVCLGQLVAIMTSDND